MTQVREKWVDDVKVFACILVVLGHFFQSMITAGILPETMLYDWFDRTIYYFHVSLFFLCSGYLYQKKTETSRWFERLIRKGISLGVPYVFFSTVTWLLKELFSDSVNSQNAGLLHTLFLEPVSPYWYLYTLFFIFLITPCFTNSKAVTLGIACAIFFKGLRILGLVESGVYAVDSVMDNAIWFVLGMLLRFGSVGNYWNKMTKLIVGVISACVFLLVSLWISMENIHDALLSTAMGIWGCVTVIMILRNCNVGRCLRGIADYLASYTMPIFLMHTIFAAGLRAVLLKLGIENPAVHVVSGITISFFGPIVAALIIERLNLGFLLCPGRYLKQVKTKESQHG